LTRREKMAMSHTEKVVGASFSKEDLAKVPALEAGEKTDLQEKIVAIRLAELVGGPWLGLLAAIRAAKSIGLMALVEDGAEPSVEFYVGRGQKLMHTAKGEVATKILEFTERAQKFFHEKTPLEGDALPTRGEIACGMLADVLFSLLSLSETEKSRG
jgi:hypothetical protein